MTNPSGFDLRLWNFTAYPTQANLSRLAFDWKALVQNPGAPREVLDKHRPFPDGVFQRKAPLHLEIGAGTGSFFIELARRFPDEFFIALERERHRANRLEKNAGKSGLKNLSGFRANAISTLVCCVPTESIDTLYILYPCPWPKNSQRKNRWYLNPVMPHFFRVLRPGGKIIWASDQEFYIDEARWVCEDVGGMSVLSYGELAPNSMNALSLFPEGRTKFERSFLHHGLPCYELIVQKRI